MQTGAITGYFDVAQLTLYAFWIFFAGLLIYLRREDKREGYPLDSDRSLRGDSVQGFPPMPKPKEFLTHGGHVIYAPRKEAPPPLAKVIPGGTFPGAPFLPTGNPMIDSVGPASYAMRADVPDIALEDDGPRIVPLRTQPHYFVDPGAEDPIGMEVVGADGVVAGVVADLWIDRPDVTIRFFEVALTGTVSHHVLLPVPFAQISARKRRIVVKSILGEQFATVPGIQSPDTITLREEDRIMGYYGGGTLYATAQRQEPFV
jgi:photosynthetic reaction center H subunit